MSNTIYTIFGYHDMDGGIAAAICLRFLNHLCKEYKYKAIFKIEPVPRPPSKSHSLAGFLRKSYKAFDMPKNFTQKYDDFIDLAELMNGKKNHLSTTQNFFSNAYKLHALFHTTHPLIDKKEIYKSLVCQIANNPNVEDLFDSEALYEKIIESKGCGQLSFRGQAPKTVLQ